tara:strand:- start:1054 stop:1308 length:255 start_codon:yes stop_codon:yes gene_type:complete
MTKEPSTEEKRPFFYTSTFDPLIAQLYNNNKCRQCDGRGYLMSEIPPEGLKYFIRGIKNRAVYTYCSCVDKNVKEQRKKEQAKK